MFLSPLFSSSKSAFLTEPPSAPLDLCRILHRTADVMTKRDEILTRPMSHYVDSLMTRLCHGKNGVVCDGKTLISGSETCLAPSDALALISAGAWLKRS